MNPDELNTTINTTDYVDDYALALDSVPPEVRRFLWSEAFTLIIKATGDTYNLNDAQRDVLKRVVMETIVGTITPVSRRATLSEAGIVGETQEKILEAIDDEIIFRTLVQIQEYNDLYTNKDNLENGTVAENLDKTTISAPSPIQALASIKERLSQASTIATTKRDYSVDKSAPVQDIVKPKIDPYREPPTK